MARRKRQFMDDDDPDSSEGSEDGDFSDENDDTSTRKKRRTNGENQAIYGSFADDDEDDDVTRRSKRTDWTRAPAFTTGEKVNPEKTNEAFVKEEPLPVKLAPPLSHADRLAFSKHEGSIGARMMAKMGYQVGTGLGATGEGIVTPVETKLRPKKAGIAFKGFDERTDQSKMEARRKARREGRVLSEDEEEVKPKTKGQPSQKRSDAWRKPARRKVQVEHKTYEQILEESGHAPQQAMAEKIIDATGGELREVASIADISLSSWTPSTEPTRIPEVRHNLRLICETCKTELEGLAREAKAVEERKRFIKQENARLLKKVVDEASLISRLQSIHLVVDDIDRRADSAAVSHDASLDDFTDLFETLVNHYSPEFEKYRLDEIVVAAMAPTMKKIVMEWQPLTEPESMTQPLRRWRTALKFNPAPKVETQIDVYSERFAPVKHTVVPDLPMTPYESLLWNVWFPKVRSAINNDWNASEPSTAVRLYECWTDLLPTFIRDNFMDQLIMPKLHKQIADWSARKSGVALQAIVFPWLPHLGLRTEEIMDDARRKIKGLFRSWMPKEGLPTELLVWKEVFDKSEWESLLLKYIVPKLGSTLREEFQINPSQQEVEPFRCVMIWHTIIRASVFSQILEIEFFPKWLDILYQWLVQPKASFDEIAEWYLFWKAEFPADVQRLPGIQQGFTYGQQLMNDAVTLGPKAKSSLPRPDYRALLKKGQLQPGSPSRAGTPKPKPRPSRTQEITFRSLVEERAANHNLLFMPTGRTHPQSRMPLYRVSAGVDGKGGIDVLIVDDAVWLVEGDDYRAITLDDMVVRAMKGKS